MKTTYQNSTEASRILIAHAYDLVDTLMRVRQQKQSWEASRASNLH